MTLEANPGLTPVQNSTPTAISSARNKKLSYCRETARQLGPFLHHFGATARFICSWPHPYSSLILGVFPLHQIAHVRRQRAHGP